jgi:hypothetical protein
MRAPLTGCILNLRTELIGQLHLILLRLDIILNQDRVLSRVLQSDRHPIVLLLAALIFIEMDRLVLIALLSEVPALLSLCLLLLDVDGHLLGDRCFEIPFLYEHLGLGL